MILFIGVATEQLLQELRNVAMATQQIQQQHASLLSNFSDLVFNQYDCWLGGENPSVTTKHDQNFKTELGKLYQKGVQKHCMLTGCTSDVTGAHIWRKMTAGKGLSGFGLSSSAVSDPRNGLLLAKFVEVAFDRQQLCFVYNPFTSQLVCRILDPAFRQQHSELEGKMLLFCNKERPFMRLLSFHAVCAVRYAVGKKWIEPNPQMPNGEEILYYRRSLGGGDACFPLKYACSEEPYSSEFDSHSVVGKAIPSNKRCFKCNEVGHIRRHCPF